MNAHVTTAKKEEIPCLVFIGGFGSGKSYHAVQIMGLIEEMFGISAYKVSLATKIKEVAADVFGMKEKDRRLLQLIGQKFREIREDVWIDYLTDDIRKNGKFPFVMDDVRLVREAELLRERFPNLVIVKIETTEAQRMEIYEKLYGRKPTRDELNDPTETEISKIKPDIVIKNDYNQATTEANIRELLRRAQDGGISTLRRH